MPEKVAGVVLVPKPSRDYLNPQQLVDYREHPRTLIQWAANLGKDPSQAEGYAKTAVRQRAYRLDKFYRWVWQEEVDGYTLAITPAHADAYMQYLAYQDDTTTYKESCQKSIQMLFRWQSFTQGADVDWDPTITYSADTGSSQPRDFLTKDERRALREAALEYDSIPHYNSVTPAERTQWKRYLAQRFGTPMEDIGRDDWERATSWKIPSLLWTTLDAGSRPVEIQRATTTWVNLENGLLRIPREDSSKNEENWTVSLQDRTVNILERWLTERATRAKYDETDALWLTQKGNRYNTHSLNYVFEQLCDAAGIATDDRDITWYSIRHSVGTYMAREEGLAAAQAQLRHKSERTTMRYDQAPIEDRKDALERMG